MWDVGHRNTGCDIFIFENNSGEASDYFSFPKRCSTVHSQADSMKRIEPSFESC